MAEMTEERMKEISLAIMRKNFAGGGLTYAYLIYYSEKAAQELDLDPDEIKEFINVLREEARQKRFEVRIQDKLAGTYPNPWMPFDDQ